jgi:hypothetical protein
MVHVAETEPFYIWLPPAEFQQDWIEEEAEALVETKFRVNTTYFMSDGSDLDAYMAFNVNFNVTDEYEEPDVLTLMLETDVPAEAMPDGALLVQWAQFRLSSGANDPYSKVACTTTVGSGADGVSIETRMGWTEFDYNTVTGSA